MEGGIEVVDLWAERGHERGKRWYFKVWDKRRRSWKCRAFPDGEKAKGWAWAEDTRALLRLEFTSSGALPFQAVAAEYVTARRGEGKNERYIAEVERVAAAVVAAGAVDMRADTFATTVRDWLVAAPSFAVGKQAPGHVTKNRWLVILKSIGKLGVTKFGLRTNPLTGIKRFKVDRKVRLALRIDQLRAMVSDAAATDPYYRLACLLVYAGLRRDEAAHVRWEWVDPEARTITLRVIRDARGRVVWAPKGNKERIVPLLDELAPILAAVPAADRGEWVVADDRYRRLEDKGHWEAFRDFLDRWCGGAGELHPHCTRHTWTALQLATGASPSRVRRWLGHAKLSTTDIYADAEAAFEHAVRGWPRGEFRLRPARAVRTVTIDLDRDLLAPLHLRLAGGQSLDAIAAATGIPEQTLRYWMLEGVPPPVRQWLALHAAPQAEPAITSKG